MERFDGVVMDVCAVFLWVAQFPNSLFFCMFSEDSLLQSLASHQSEWPSFNCRLASLVSVAFHVVMLLTRKERDGGKTSCSAKECTYNFTSCYINLPFSHHEVMGHASLQYRVL